MKVRINSYKAAVFAVLLTAGACKKSVSYTPLQRSSVSSETVRVLDSLRNEGKKITSNPDFVHLGADTLKLNKNFDKNPDRFMQNAERILNDKYNDKVLILNNDAVYDNVKRIGAKTEYDMYINKTAVISGYDLYTKDSKTIYVPVEYYGQQNPEVRSFL